MSISRSIKSYFVTNLLSLKLSRLMMWSIDGDVSCSSLAERITETTASCMHFSFVKFQWPTIERYLSNMPWAANSVSSW